MQISVRKDTLSGDLRARAAAARNKRPILSAMGQVVVQQAKLAFNTPRLRPTPWPAKADGTPATLRKNQVLARSPRVISVDGQRAIVGSDRKYAAIHQLGGRTGARTIRAKGRALKFSIGGRTIFAKSVKHPGAKVPARPYFPFLEDGTPTPTLRRNLEAAVRLRLDGRRGA